MNKKSICGLAMLTGMVLAGACGFELQNREASNSTVATQARPTVVVANFKNLRLGQWHSASQMPPRMSRVGAVPSSNGPRSNRGFASPTISRKPNDGAAAPSAGGPVAKSGTRQADRTRSAGALAGHSSGSDGYITTGGTNGDAFDDGQPDNYPDGPSQDSEPVAADMLD